MGSFWHMLGFKSPLNKKSKYDKNPIWQAKRIELVDVTAKIPNGSNISIGSSSATTHATLAAMVENKSLLDINILQFIVGGELPHIDEHASRFRVTTNFAFDKVGKKSTPGYC